MGLVQLARAQEMCARRTEIALAYNHAFAGVPAVQCPSSPESIEHAWHLYPLRLNEGEGPGRDEFVAELVGRGVGNSVHFIPLHLHSYYVATYGYSPDDFPIATEQFGRVVSLPIYSAMTDSDVARVIDAVTASIDHGS
jgi:dTDP-4-amino-4,6-dideoxygalactose transaminase